jgi:CHAT domain-containing protein
MDRHGRRNSRKKSPFFYCCLGTGVFLFAFATLFLDLLPTYGSGHGGHGGGGRRGGGGVGIGIGIGIVPRGDASRGVDFDKVERDLKGAAPSNATFDDDEASPRKVKTATKPLQEIVPSRKLIKARVPYLVELAMDIDQTLMELALTEPANAIKLYKNAAARAKSKGDAQAERDALQHLAHVYYVIGQFQNAAENYARVLGILQKLRNPEQEAIAARNLSAVLIASADYPEAGKYVVEALDVLGTSENNRAAAMTLNNAGVLEKRRGRFEKAEISYGEALKRYDRPDPIRLVTLNNLGTLYRTRGLFNEAVASFQTSLNEAKALGNPKAEAEALDQIGQTYAERGTYDKALESWQQAVEVLTRAGAPVDVLQKKIGDLYMDMGKVEEAKPYVTKADYDSSLGRLRLATSEPDAAKKYYEQLLSAAQKEANLDALFTAYTGLGKVYEAAGKYQEAEKAYAKALEVTEDIRSTLLLSERRNFFTQKVNGFLRSEPGKGLVRVMLKQKKLSQSIEPSESVRAREFSDFLFQKAEARYFDVPPEMLEKEMVVNDKVASLKIALGVIPKALDSERFTAVTNQIKSAETQKKSFVQELSTKHKDYVAVKYPKPVTLDTCAVGPNEYVLLFDVLGEDVGVRLIKGKKVIAGSVTPWPVAQLEEEIRTFRKPFEEAKLADFSPDLAASLYAKVLGDVLGQVPEGASITIIPDGLLALLPFEALVTGGKAQWKKGQWGDYPEGISFVGDRNPIIYYQSLTALTLARSLRQTPKSAGRVLVMADPVFQMADARLRETQPEIEVAQNEENRQVGLMAAIEEDSVGCFALNRLKGTEKLAKSLEQIYGSSCEVYTGLEATKGMFMQKLAPELTRYDAIVFATHGFAGNNIPGIMEPVLAFTMVPPGTDGFLTMNEVAGLKTNADIVALTACQTGVGVHMAGEGVLSMGRAFQCAGARSVAMSLWSVSEDCSVALMDEFFKRVKGGQARLAAWTDARAQVRKAGFEHPFFWAAFVLVGEAR